MKKLLILILLIPISLFSQSHINRDIVNKEFQRLLNEERKNNGLSPLFIDTVHTQMEDDWSENIAYRYESDMEKTKLKLYRSGKKKIKYSLPNYHGEGENDFDKRFERYYPNFHTRVRGECLSLFGLYVNYTWENFNWGNSNWGNSNWGNSNWWYSTGNNINNFC